MAKCPACGHDVRTPFFLSLNAWAHLTCNQCKAKLEVKPPRSAKLGPFALPLIVLARYGWVLEAILFAFIFLTVFLLLLESSRPKLQLRKRPLPEPAIRLKY